MDGGECRAARAVCVPHRDGHPTGPPRGASPRHVRFYEAKSLITSTRRPNNCRDYSEAALGRVQQIRELLNAGLSTQAIRAILPVRRRCCRTENGDRADRHHTIARFPPSQTQGKSQLAAAHSARFWSSAR
ncbi:MerR family transcriptional regulator [Streptomyces sp. NPDC054794]